MRSSKFLCGYTQASSLLLKEKEISLRAKGLYAVMSGLPADWTFSVHGLASICKDGQDSIRSSLRELEKAGYLIREQRKGNSGRFTGLDYRLVEPVSSEPPM